jgi:hypothetical protein
MSHPFGRAKTVSLAPLAFTSGGDWVINAAEYSNDVRPETLLRVAVATGLPVFIGVIVPVALRARLAKDVDDAAADIAGRLGAKLIKAKATP